MDMPTRYPLDLMNEVEEVLKIHSSALNWPIGTGKEFIGVVDRTTQECLFFTKTAAGGAQKALISRFPLHSSEVKERLGLERFQELLQELELLDAAGNEFSREKFLTGEVTPSSLPLH